MGLKGGDSRSTAHNSGESDRIKRPKRSSSPSIIDDLPDPLLVEILCRLPKKLAFQCMLVSKRWCTLISDDPYFLGRFLCLQSVNQTPITRTLIFSDRKHQKIEFLPLSAEPPISPPRSFDNEWPFEVLGTYNDLVLCCAKGDFQRDYYIWNVYTNQCVALPSAPGCHEQVRVGFICDPFYDQVDETTFNINYEYSFRVVRIIPQRFSSGISSTLFNVEIFSSETAKWTQSVVLSPRSFCFDTLVHHIGLVHQGMLYWCSLEGFIIGLDPYNHSYPTNNNIDDNDHKYYYCRYIEMPKDGIYRPFVLLGVCPSTGGLRTCELSDCLGVWEFNDDDDDDDDDDEYDDDDDPWSLTELAPLEDMVSENPLFTKWKYGRWINNVRVLAFDPNNKHNVYLQLGQHLVMCNIHTKTLEQVKATTTPYNVCSASPQSLLFPYVLSWWPTPVPR